MTSKDLALCCVLALSTAAIPYDRAAADERYCSDSNPRILRVEMYPFIPDFSGAALLIKSKFEKGCPGLDLQINANQNYYSATGGILDAKADLYEVDSVFFDDFVKTKQPQLPSQSLLAASGPVVPFAKDVATSNGAQYGVPHWLCSDFLIYRQDHTQLQNLKKPGDAASLFREPSQGLLMDIKGKLTIGELYLSILVAHYGSVPAALSKLDPNAAPDDAAVSTLRSFLSMEPPGFGRLQHYHDVDGFYARQLSRGSGSAFVGY